MERDPKEKIKLTNFLYFTNNALLGIKKLIKKTQLVIEIKIAKVINGDAYF